MPAGAAAAAACCCYCHGLKIPLSQSTEGSVSMRRRVSHRNARQNSALKKHHPERSPMARRAVSVFVGTAARRHFIFPIIHRLNLSCLSLGIPRTTSSRLGSMCSGVPISSFFFFTFPAASGEALFCRRRLATSILPYLAATCRGLNPFCGATGEKTRY